MFLCGDNLATSIPAPGYTPQESDNISLQASHLITTITAISKVLKKKPIPLPLATTQHEVIQDRAVSAAAACRTKHQHS